MSSFRTCSLRLKDCGSVSDLVYIWVRNIKCNDWKCPESALAPIELSTRYISETVPHTSPRLSPTLGSCSRIFPEFSFAYFQSTAENQNRIRSSLSTILSLSEVSFVIDDHMNKITQFPTVNHLSWVKTTRAWLHVKWHCPVSAIYST